MEEILEATKEHHINIMMEDFNEEQGEELDYNRKQDHFNMHKKVEGITSTRKKQHKGTL